MGEAEQKRAYCSTCKQECDAHEVRVWREEKHAYDVYYACDICHEKVIISK